MIQINFYILMYQGLTPDQSVNLCLLIETVDREKSFQGQNHSNLVSLDLKYRAKTTNNIVRDSKTLQKRSFVMFLLSLVGS